MGGSRPTHRTVLTAVPQHLVAFEQVVPHQLADLVLSLALRLQDLHLGFRRRLPLEVVICPDTSRGSGSPAHQLRVQTQRYRYVQLGLNSLTLVTYTSIRLWFNTKLLIFAQFRSLTYS